MDLVDLFFEEHPNAMLIYELETLQILKVNKSAVKKYGYYEEEFLRLTMEDIWPKNDIPAFHDAFQDLDRGSHTFNDGTFRHLTKENKILSVQITAQFYKYEGKDARIIHIHDFTDLVKLKNKYKTTLEELNHQIDGNPLAMVKYDSEFRFTDWSRRAEDKLGYTRDEVLGKTSFELGITPEQEEKMIKEEMEKMSRGEIDKVRLNSLVNKKDGKQIFIRVHASAFRDENDDLKSVLVFFEDIDDQIRKDLLFKNTQQIAEIGGWEYNPNTDDLFWTDEVYKIHEIPVGEPIDVERALKYYPPEDKTKIERGLEGVIEKQKKYDVTVQLNTAEGNKKWVRAMGRPVLRNGRLFKVSGTFQDITNQKTKELEIESTSREKEVLLAEIHHRVKNNLAIISGLLELKAMNIDNEEMTEIIEQSQMRIQSMALIHEALYKAKDFTNLEFSSFLEDLINAIEDAHKSENKDISIELNHIDSLELNVNQAIPSGLIMNEVITNSFKHAFTEQKRGKIDVVVNYVAETDEVILRVTDNGKGLPESFLKGETDSLGARLIHQLTEQLDAELNVRNNEGAFIELKFLRDGNKSGPSGRNISRG